MGDAGPATRIQRLRGWARVIAIRCSTVVCCLQLEGKRLRAAGIHGLLQEPKTCGDLTTSGKRLLVAELDRKNNDSVELEYVGESADANHALAESADSTGFWAKFDPTIGTTPWAVQPEDALNIFCDVSERLRCLKASSVDAGETLVLRKDPTTDYLGGYSNEYKQTERQASSDVLRQVVWMWKASGYHAAVGKLLHPSRAQFVQATVDQLNHQFYPEAIDPPLKLAAVQLLIPWHPDAVFTYHQDPIGDWAVIINLSPATSALHVAGSENLAQFFKAGDAHIISTSLVHRSGLAQLRTMKLVLFLKEELPLKQPATELASASANQGAPGSDGVVPLPGRKRARETIERRTTRCTANGTDADADDA